MVFLGRPGLGPQVYDRGEAQEHSSRAGTSVTLMHDSDTRDAVTATLPGKVGTPWARLQPTASPLLSALPWCLVTGSVSFIPPPPTPLPHFPILCSNSLLLSAFWASLSSRDISRNSRRRWKVRSNELGFPSRLLPVCSARRARGAGLGSAPWNWHSLWGRGSVAGTGGRGAPIQGSQVSWGARVSLRDGPRGHCRGEQVSEGRKSRTRTEAAEIILTRIAATPGPEACKSSPPPPPTPTSPPLLSGVTRGASPRWGPPPQG